MKKRYLYIDLLNCFAIFSVLMLHSSQLAFSGDPNSTRTIVCKVIQAIFIPAVYIFFMNSGAMLVNYRERQTTRTFMLRRIKRVLVPFLIWSVIYYFYDQKFALGPLEPGPLLVSHPSIQDFLLKLVTNNINNIFWFFYAIMAIYLALPVVSLAAQKHKNYLFFLVILSFLLNDVSKYLGAILHVNLQNQFFNFTLMIFLPYCLLGYLIKEDYFTNTQENLIIIMGLLTLATSFIEIFWLGTRTILNNTAPMLYSTAIYLLLKKGADWEFLNKPIIHTFLFKASGCSLSMYVLHIMFYRAFDSLLHINNTSYIHIIIMPIFIYLLGTFFIYEMRKLKIIRTILP